MQIVDSEHQINFVTFEKDSLSVFQEATTV